MSRIRLALVTVLAAAFAVFLTTGASAVTGSPSNFESGDGNMALTTSGNTDWNCFVGTTGFQAGTPNTGCAVKTGATQTWADGGTSSVGSAEFQFKSGTKFDDQCPVINSGNNPPKDEWTNVAEYTEAAANHDLYFYGATIRPVVNGNSSGNVYFNQGTNPAGPGCHTVGDILLTFDFLGGGGSPTLHSLTWLGSGSCFVSQDSPPCWGNQQTINSADFDGNINTQPIAASANGISGTALSANAFAEFGINLTQALKDQGISTVPCFSNQTWVSRSSGSSFTSNPEDVETVNKPTCGTITIIKHTDPRGLDQSFSYSTTGGLSPATFNLNDSGNSTADNAANTRTYTSVQAGQYTVTEGSEPFGFVLESLTCSGGSTSVSGATATINLGFGDSVTCTYTNQQELQGIKITKTSSKDGRVLPGAVFTIKDSGGNQVPGSPATTGADGTVCVDHLPFGSYSIQETQAPTGYAIDDSTSHTVTLNTNGHCGTGTEVPFAATDTPLTDFTVHVASEQSNGTKSNIQCKQGSTTVASSGATNTNPADASASGLLPGTYVCTIVIDP